VTRRAVLVSLVELLRRATAGHGHRGGRDVASWQRPSSVHDGGRQSLGSGPAVSLSLFVCGGWPRSTRPVAVERWRRCPGSSSILLCSWPCVIHDTRARGVVVWGAFPPPSALHGIHLHVSCFFLSVQYSVLSSLPIFPHSFFSFAGCQQFAEVLASVCVLFLLVGSRCERTPFIRRLSCRVCAHAVEIDLSNRISQPAVSLLSWVPVFVREASATVCLGPRQSAAVT